MGFKNVPDEIHPCWKKKNKTNKHETVEREGDRREGEIFPGLF